MFFTAFTRRYTADDMGAVVDHFLGMKGTDAAGKALDNDRCFFV